MKSDKCTTTSLTFFRISGGTRFILPLKEGDEKAQPSVGFNDSSLHSSKVKSKCINKFIWRRQKISALKCVIFNENVHICWIHLTIQIFKHFKSGPWFLQKSSEIIIIGIIIKKAFLNQGWAGWTSGTSNISKEIKVHQQVRGSPAPHSHSFGVTLMTTLSVPISSALLQHPFFKLYDSFNCCHLLPDRPAQQPLWLTCVDADKEVY